MIYFIGYVLCTIGSALGMNNLGTKYSPNLLMTLSIIYAIIFFNIISYKNIKNVYRALYKQKILYLILMVSIAMIWAETFIGNIFMSPAFFLFVLMTVGAAYGSIFNYVQYKTWQNLLEMILICGVLCIFYVYLLSYYSGTKLLLIIMFTIILGLFDYLYGYVSYKIAQDNNLNAAEILASRFWILLLLSIIVSIYKKDYIVIEQQWKELLPQTFGLSLITFILPIYLYQKTILKMGVNPTLMMCGLIPFLIFIIEKLCLSLDYTSPFLGWLSIMLFLITLIKAVLTWRQYKNE